MIIRATFGYQLIFQEQRMKKKVGLSSFDETQKSSKLDDCSSGIWK